VAALVRSAMNLAQKVGVEQLTADQNEIDADAAEVQR
jgi:hypothetical protein